MSTSQDGLPLHHALEVHNESFHDPEFIEMVGKKRAAIVHADHAEFPLIDADTADFVYARIMQVENDKPEGYFAAILQSWVDKALGWATDG